VLDEDLGDELEVRMGEAAHDGPVALSWWHSQWAGRRLGKANVVLHEFAHKMAELGDPDLGMPPFVSSADAKKWKKVMVAARRRLDEDDMEGKDTLLDPYGAESLPEFFAVATETFFLQPAELRADMPAVYNLLSSCYRQDPSLRRVPAELLAMSKGAEEEYNRQAVLEYTNAIRLHPGQAEFYSLRAGYREELGDIEGAITDLRDAARLAADLDERCDALFDLADVLERQGRLDEAREAEEEAQRLLE
jgi:tetratricopeptide (TPR) repeat protein